jgi:hypothetical protein
VEPRSARAPDAEPDNFRRGKFKRNHFIETAGLKPAF